MNMVYGRCGCWLGYSIYNTYERHANQLAQMRIERSVPAGHTASETFDVGKDLGSPVALDYLERAPFEFSGKIETIDIKYTN